MRWRLLLSPPASGAENMAMDEALLERARGRGECVLRVYEWARPTLSFGRHQAARGAYDSERLIRRGVDVVRRPTGGRAILHHREVTYSVTAPASPAGSLRESYGRINRLLVEALRTLGVPAAIVGDDRRTPAPGTLPCFARPSAGELTVGGRKLVGSAQWREEDAMLQHGSILVEDDQSAIAELLARPAEAAPRPATLHEALGRIPAAREVAEALFDAVRRHEDARAEPLALEAPLLATVARLRDRYADVAWTWRR